MRSLLSLLFFILFLQHTSSFAQMNVGGTYIGKNIYIQNIARSTDTLKIEGYCVDSVYVNDSLVLVSPKSSVFELDLSFIKLEHKVDIKIFHRSGCNPVILNDNDILSGIDFSFTGIEVNEKELEWFTQGESVGSFYIAEHFWLNNWITMDTLENKSSSVKSGYRIPVNNLSGDNLYKISYYAPDSSLVEEVEKKYFSHKKAITFNPKRVVDVIRLSEKTRYQIYDKNGKKMLFSGIAQEIDCSSLKGGKNKYYLLVMDNQISKFLKL